MHAIKALVAVFALAVCAQAQIQCLPAGTIACKNSRVKCCYPNACFVDKYGNSWRVRKVTLIWAPLEEKQSVCCTREKFSSMTSLCSLPFELIEEISRFFKRSESVRVLRVNSVLHEAFARRIWRHITSSEGTVWNAPPSAWTHYGPLTASIRLSGLFKRADLLIMAAWISDVEKRAQDVAVEWKLVTGGETTSQMDVILDAITKPELHSFNIRLVQSIYEFEQKSKFAAMMVEIRLPHAAMGVKPSLLNEVLSWKGVVFSRLRRLNLHLLVYKVEHGNGNDLDEDEGWYDVSDEEDAADDNDMNGDDGNVPTFPASRFPALESLNIVMLGGYIDQESY
ncbi:hypothetical protein GQ42DRAFT_154095 [Ramicandelaber brevisporus]|nr:hypothetical protein GQ42DRAFT_154095 [Ramicandelaber brevisporus]